MAEFEITTPSGQTTRRSLTREQVQTLAQKGFRIAGAAEPATSVPEGSEPSFLTDAPEMLPPRPSTPSDPATTEPGHVARLQAQRQGPAAQPRYGDQRGPLPDRARTVGRGIDAPAGPTPGAAFAQGALDPFHLGAEAQRAGAAVAEAGQRFAAPTPALTAARMFGGGGQPVPGRTAGRGSGAPLSGQSRAAAIGQDVERQQAIASEQQPGAYGGGQLLTETAATAPLAAARPVAATGALGRNLAAKAAPRATAPSVRAMFGAGAGAGAGYGAVSGAGRSRGETAGEVIGDAAKDAIWGALVGGSLSALVGRAAMGSRRPERLAGKAQKAGQRADRARTEAIGAAGMGEPEAEMASAAERLFPGRAQSASDYARRASEARPQLGERVGQAVQRASEEMSEAIAVSDFAARLQQLRDRFARGVTPEDARQARYIERIMQAIDKRHAGQKYLSPADLQAIKTSMDARGYPSSATRGLPAGDRQVAAREIGDTARSALREVIEGQAQPAPGRRSPTVLPPSSPVPATQIPAQSRPLTPQSMTAAQRRLNPRETLLRLGAVGDQEMAPTVRPGRMRGGAAPAAQPQPPPLPAPAQAGGGGGITPQTRQMFSESMRDYDQARTIEDFASKAGQREQRRPEFARPRATAGDVMTPMESGRRIVRDYLDRTFGVQSPTQRADIAAGRLRGKQQSLQGKAERARRMFGPPRGSGRASDTAAAGAMGPALRDKVYGQELQSLPPAERADRLADLAQEDPEFRARQRKKAEQQEQKGGAR